MEKICDYKLEGDFPLVIKPQNTVSDFSTFIQDFSKNKKYFHELLLKHGALLFRGFPVSVAEEFVKVIEALDLGEFVNYIGGDSPRDKVKGSVYTSTEAPPSMRLLLHQELSFMKKFPRHIYFYCETAPEIGGETIIGDARKVFSALNPEVRERFQSKELTYTSRYYYKSKIMEWINRFRRSHKSWIEVFESDDKKEVEKKCEDKDFIWHWLHNDWLEIKQTRPAILTHPVTQETVWFNQAHLYDFNPRHLGWGKYIVAKLFYWRESTLLHDIKYADGSPIAREDLYHVMDVLQQHTVAYPWQEKDVMVVDNILGMHGRAPFSGKRRILTALTV